MKAFLVLEDGSVFEGESFGEIRETVFEVVFNTSMTGYLEILTDMSYAGQGVALTYPMIGNYGVNLEDTESETPLIKALIVSDLSELASNFRSQETLQAFMCAHSVPGISRVDIRSLTTHIRSAGTMNAALIYRPEALEGAALEALLANIRKYDGAREAMDLLAARQAAEYARPVKEKAEKPGLLQVALIDFGAKKSIRTMLEKRGCEVTVFPYDVRSEDVLQSPIRFDGIMLSNGPGDPKRYQAGRAAVCDFFAAGVPMFGICLGHQILALATGANTVKLKYGHRGANHPVKDLDTGRVAITSQNHGYVVEASSLDERVAYVSQINVNDRTVEGLRYHGRNVFSVQYHPEACAGPQDTEFLFDEFVRNMREYRSSRMKEGKVRSVMVVGSGPIVIGQAAEFDYAGTQACRALREEGVYTILVNSNPATIMTDTDVADKVYIEPLTVDELMRIIRIEKPEGILATLGGQTGLNLVMELEENGFLKENHVRLIGTTSETIRMAEDRQAFKDTMEAIHEPCVESLVVSQTEAAENFADKVGLPVIIRPAYTLGGTGGGIAYTREELREIASGGLRASRVHQILVEKCIAGWKEIEYECMRDHNGNAITVCSMENVDPVGIHTGDSIVVAPVQTLTDKENQMLRSSALRIVSALGITGGCNVQFALNPEDGRYAVIEVNPRVSRSSALASKATGYPIAKVAAKIALGYSLDEIRNAVTGTTYASFEPALDYIAVKIPTWPFDKFTTATRALGTQMKATGEVLAIAGTFEAGLLKAVRSLDGNMDALQYNRDKFRQMSDGGVVELLSVKDDHRLFVIIEALRRGIDMALIHDITKIDVWFLSKIRNIVAVERALQACPDIAADTELLHEAKYKGFTDKMIAEYVHASEEEIRALRLAQNIRPVYNMVDTCAAEFEAVTPYFYSTYIRNPMRTVCADGRADGLQTAAGGAASGRGKILVLGAGPIRIGQGIEFDYCSVHAVWALKKSGYETIIINNNPETVSTDFDIADRLYFEPLTPEDVESVVRHENPCGAIVQFGGQTAIKLAGALEAMGVPILGTTVEGINNAEDRECFDAALEKCRIRRPEGRVFFTVPEALHAAREIGYPVLVRPSYVLGGQGMSIAYSDDEVRDYMDIIRKYVQGSENKHPILMDKYVSGTEVEVDAVCDGTDVLIPGIMQHEERAGIHSGDSISVYPPQTLSEAVKRKIVDYTTTLTLALGVLGMINIQFIVSGEEVYIIEANPRSSRTVPYISKVTHLPVVDVAIRCILGEKLRDMGYGVGLYPEARTVAVKMPVFSFEKIKGADISLGPEMKSTGEVLGVSESYTEALYKAFKGAGIVLPAKAPAGKSVAICVNRNDKKEIAPVAAAFRRMGYTLRATHGTCEVLRRAGIEAQEVPKIHEGGDTGEDLLSLIEAGEIVLVINTPTHGRNEHSDGFKIRRAAVEHEIPCLTSIDTAKALVKGMERESQA